MSEKSPEGWFEKKLGELSSPVMKKSEFNNQFEPLTSSRGGLVRQSDYFKKQVTSGDNTGYRIVSNGDFTFRAMSDDGTFKFNRSKFRFDGIVSPAYEVFRAQHCDGDYLSYILDSNALSKKIYASAQGGTRLALKYSKLAEIELPIPPLAEQEKIASILISVDKVIENTQKQIDKLQDLKKATLNELLTKGVGHTEFKDSELGKIPKNWEIFPLNQASTIPNGQVDPKEERYSCMKHVGSGNIKSWTGEIFDITSAREAGQISGKYLFSEKHILYSKVRPNLAKVCFPKFNGLCSADIYPLLPRENLVGEFLFQTLMTEDFVAKATEVSDRTGMPKINRQEMGLLKIKIPPPDEQIEICRVLQAIDERRKKIGRKLKQTQFLKKSLMQDLLTGKVRVKAN